VTPPNDHSGADPAHTYLLADTAPAPELARLQAIDELLGPITEQRLTRLGVSSGWRCLDVGAGTGGVARWLADRVGPSGHVTATDLAPRFTAPADCRQLEIRRHDVMDDGLEPAHYHLVHCRLLLTNVASVERALDRMVAALRPGGWLIVEEPGDTRTPAVGEADPRVAEFNRLYQDFLAAMQARTRAVDLTLYRRLPGLLEAAGLRDFGGEVTHPLVTGRERGALRGTLDAVRPLLNDTPFGREGQLDRLVALAAEPSLLATGGATVGLWGRRPA
jgi:SAM-dependent methyltransferase